MKTQTKIPW